jgi:DNA-binding response OmpR family regulator
MSDKVLVVEDDTSLLDALAYNLEREGYQVTRAADGLAGLALARSERPDLVILDVTLPGADGIEVCGALRREMDIPILMLMAPSERSDRRAGLQAGADACLAKPLAMPELLARIRALRRRDRMTRERSELALPAAEPAGTLQFGNLSVSQARREVHRDGLHLQLKPKEYELLLFLARNRGVVLTRDIILERVWGWEFAGGTRTVDVHVRWLREKIEDDPGSPTRIVTVRGAGYRFDG